MPVYSEIISHNYHAAHNISHVTSENYLIHSHDFYEFHYFIDGDIRYLYAGTEYTPKPHTLMIFPPDLVHGIHVVSEKPYDRYTLHFTEDLLAHEHRALLMSSLPTAESVRTNRRTIPYMIENADELELMPIFEEYQKLVHEPEALRSCMTSTLTQLLLSKLMVYASAQAPLPVENTRQTVNPELESILSYINQNLTRKLSLDILTEHFFISKSKLNALFHKRMNCTVMEFITRRRLNYAQQLLMNGFSAAQAGAAAGFGDYTSFYRAYSKYVGHSPARDMRSSPLVADPYPLQDRADTGGGSTAAEQNQQTIWDTHRFVSATEIDVSALRDTWQKR